MSAQSARRRLAASEQAREIAGSRPPAGPPLTRANPFLVSVHRSRGKWCEPRGFKLAWIYNQGLILMENTYTASRVHLKIPCVRLVQRLSCALARSVLHWYQRRRPQPPRSQRALRRGARAPWEGGARAGRPEPTRERLARSPPPLHLELCFFK